VRQPLQPLAEQRIDPLGGHTVADLLQALRIGAVLNTPGLRRASY
jgi:hypothetical protein